MNGKRKWNMVYLFIGFLLFVFAPIEVYLLSIEDLWFSIYDFAIYLLLIFCVYVFGWVLYELLLAPRINTIDTIMSSLLFSIGIALYIQGNIVKTNYGELNGKEIDWSKYAAEGLLSVAIFGVAIVGAIVAIAFAFRKGKSVKLKKFNNIASIMMMLLMAYTLVTLVILNNGLQSKSKYISISEGRWDYSSKENYIILVLDNFDSRLLDDLLKGEDREEVEQIFGDFTYFEDAKGFYEYTMMALPQILTGERYLNDQVYADYLNEAFQKSPFLNELIDEEYQLKIHTTNEIPQGDVNQKVDNWKYMKIGVDSHKRLLTYIYKLCGFRYLPQQLKQYCWFYTDDMDDIKTVSYYSSDEEVSDENGHYEWGNWYFHDNMDRLNTSIEEPVFHFTHIKGCHDIRDMGPDFRLLDYEKEGCVSRYDAAHMSVRLVGQYLDELKKEGIYDNSVIVIMADHGQIEYDDYVSQPCAQSPILIAKGKNEQHDFSSSDLKVSYDDLQKFFIEMLKGKAAVDAMGIIESDRIRYTYITDFSAPARKNREHPMNEYAVYGTAKDGSQIKETGNQYK